MSEGFLAGFIVGIVAMFLVGVWCQAAAYRNGVNDGYGYAREPWNPGYALAEEIIHAGLKSRVIEAANDQCGAKVSIGADESSVCSECREDGCSENCCCWCHGPK